ncbi:MAG: peptide ABC transporter substrate-binding protein [candidate division Zixibacteria bacterium]|nr:peptide ABC transporter substrate-binding protein [candidate division Zixibacteria bacterium]
MMRLLSLSLCGVCLLALAASPLQNRVGAPLPPDALSVEKQVIRILFPGNEPRTLDATLDNYGSGRVEFLFDRLTMLDEDERLLPGVAESWKASPDGKAWTFRLRADARWSDGRPVTAQDFEWTYKTLLEPSIGNVYAFLFYEIKGARAFNLDKSKDPKTVGVRAVDERTFVIETEKPCPYLPYLTSYLSAAPIPRWQYEKYGKSWATAAHIVTNGAYRVAAWVAGQRMTFARNPRYGGPYPGLLERVELSFMTTGGVLAYENNEIDILHGVLPGDLQHVISDSRLKRDLVTWPHTQTQYLFFQTQRPPFDDVLVRQAIAGAIDRETLCRVVRNGLGIPAYTMLPPGFPGYSGDRLSGIQAYAPDRARRRLAEAGYPGGRGFPKMPLWIGQGDPAGRDLAQALQGMLQENLGIRVDIQPQEGTVYMTRLYQHAIPMGIGGFQSDYPDPHNLLAMVWRSQPKGHGRHDWINSDFDRLVDTADFEMDPAKRMRLYSEAEEILATDTGGVFLFHTVLAQLRQPRVRGFVTNKRGFRPFWTNHITHTRLYMGR